MDNHELRLEVRRFCGAPMISAEGRVDTGQCETLRSLLRSFKWKGHAHLIVDLSRVEFGDTEGRDALVTALQGWHPEMNVHLVATGDVAQILITQRLPFRSHLHSSADEAAEFICRSHRMVYDLVEQSIREQEAEDLPLAA